MRSLAASARPKRCGNIMESKLFSDELAFNVSNPHSYARGKEYFEDGGVEKIWEEAGEYKALVRGTHVYEISMKFGEDNELEYQCSCPYELDGACKHVVAAILKFSKNTKYAKSAEPKKTAKVTVDVAGLLDGADSYQMKSFLEKSLIKNPLLVEDFKIFLQGQKQTPVTVGEYETQFLRKLEKLDLKSLLESFYSEGEGYFDNDYESDNTEALGSVIRELTYQASKYEENGNIGESSKIYQAMLKALAKKRALLRGDLADLSDLFDDQISQVIDWYIQSLAKAAIPEIKEAGVSYLVSVFKGSAFSGNRSQVAGGLERVITNRQEAAYALEHLDPSVKKEKIDLAESSLLAFLYTILKDEKAFEETSLNNLDVNPGLAINLLKFYWEKGFKEKVLGVANRVLKNLSGPNNSDDDTFSFDSTYNHKEIEINIRRFLNGVLSPQGDYGAAKDNRERLFLVTGLIDDYKEAVRVLQTREEKERFWQKIKGKFNDEYKVKTAFKVFELEDQKGEVLELIKKFPKSDCFPEMVDFVMDLFPMECFAQYKNKIEDLLKIPKTENYPVAVRFLWKMQKIDLPKEFTDYLNYIKVTYGRRPRLMEELRKVGA